MRHPIDDPESISDWSSADPPFQATVIVATLAIGSTSAVELTLFDAAALTPHVGSDPASLSLTA